MPKIKGDALILSIYDEDNTAYRPVACLTSNSLNRTVNIIESQTKCAPGEIEKTKGTQTYSLSADGEYQDSTSVGGSTATASHDYLMEAMDNDAITWRMSTGLADTPFYYGTAIISDLSLTGDAGDAVSTFSTTFEGSGLIVTTDPKAGA
tara:strand:- start:12424 stop:12873 length:450 start_codon:yes stop_codon:yes gene_type:complete